MITYNPNNSVKKSSTANVRRLEVGDRAGRENQLEEKKMAMTIEILNEWTTTDGQEMLSLEIDGEERLLTVEEAKEEGLIEK